MTVTGFTPVGGTLGGVLIGLAAAVLLLCNGDIFGCSGITSSAFLHPKKTMHDQSWKLVFLACFFLTSSIYPASVTYDTRLYEDSSVAIPSLAGYIVGGFLVSFGTSLGNGCTTGHGVCGMARLSLRSIIAVCTFMMTAVGTAILTSPGNDLIGAFRKTAPVLEPIELAWVGWILSSIFIVWALLAVLRRPQAEEEPLEGAELGVAAGSNGGDLHIHIKAAASWAKLIPAGAAGALFSGGLAWSGMALQSKNFAFLDLTMIPLGLWDPTLILVMVAAVMVSFISYQFVPGYSKIPNIKTLECPLMVKDGEFNVPKRTDIDFRLLGGAFCFGVGWGISGLCPGPGLLQAASGNQAVVYLYCPFYLVGMFVADRLKTFLDNRQTTASSDATNYSEPTKEITVP